MHSAGPNPTVSDSAGLGWDSETYVSNKFPDRADSAGVGSTLWKETTALKYSLFPEAPFWAHEEYHYLLHRLGRQWGWK